MMMTTRELRPLEIQAIRRASVRLIETALQIMRIPEDLEARGTLEETARKVYDEAALIFEAVTGPARPLTNSTRPAGGGSEDDD